MQSFATAAVYHCCGLSSLVLSGIGPAQTIKAAAVSDEFFETVRIRPLLGRTFRSEEDSPGRSHVAILSERFWRTNFGGDRTIVGRTIRLNDVSYNVVGVIAPASTAASWFPMEADLWVPLALTDDQRVNRQNHNLEGIARLKPDVDVAQARAELGAVSARLAREYPTTDRRWGAEIVPLREAIVGDSKTTLLVLFGAVGMLLLIACANVGNMLFARALGRRKEVAIRLALGASGGRVVQQLLVEALLLAGIGGALGLMLALTTLRATSALVARHVPRAGEISLDWSVVLFAIAASMVAGLIAGTLPAQRAIRSDVRGSLQESGRSSGGLGVGTRRALIACEVALSLVLLMASGLMLRTLLALHAVETGFDPSNVLTMNVRLIEARYPTAAQRSAFFDAALERIRALPGVEAAGTIDDVPFTDGSAQPLRREEYAGGDRTGKGVVQVRHITPGYLRTMRIPILRGRDVAANDGEVIVVSEDAARLVWGADDPLGRRGILSSLSKTTLREVVGVVGDVRQRGPTGPRTPSVYYYSHDGSSLGATIVVRTSLVPATMRNAIVDAIHSVSAEQPVEDIRTMDDVVAEKLSSQRFSTALLGGFAGMALLLAGIGIYGVVSYIVRGRRREISIRTALGARRGDVLRLVIMEAMTPALLGIAVGIVIALVAGRVMKSLVFGVRVSDPLTLIAVATILAFVALAASAVPAYRATRFDLQNALRAE
jgi:predicted permease